jgi:hypothetical protein
MNNNLLSIKEAQIKISQGHRLRHDTFHPGEFIYQASGQVYDQTDTIEAPVAEYWASMAQNAVYSTNWELINTES